MKIRFLSLVILLLINLNSIYAQVQFRLEGHVRDSISKESLIGALVQVKGTAIGAVCDKNGYYSIILSKGKHVLEVSYLGYSKKVLEIDLERNRVIDFLLSSYAQKLAAVSVVADEKGKNVENNEIGVHHLNMKEIKQIPQVLGESDPVKAIQLLPGIQSAGEGNTGYHVRGGSIDQNLILIDDVPIYNASHLFGFFSIFNSNAINEVSIIKGSMPANYGGRLASVLDISTKAGDFNKYHFYGGIGLLSSNLTMEGPIKKNVCSFIVSARRTYIDAFKKVINQNQRFYQNYYFYDVNAKLAFRLSKKDYLFLTTYSGSDVFEYNDAEKNYFTNNIKWGTELLSLKWAHHFNEKLNLDISTGVSDYNMDFSSGLFSYNLLFSSKIKDYSSRIQVTHTFSERQELKYGLENIYHGISPQNISLTTTNSEFDLDRKSLLNSLESAAYICDEIKLNSRLNFNVGMRFSLFQQLGPFDRYVANEYHNNIDTISYSRNEVVQRYQYPEPRIAIRYLINKKSSFKIGFTQNAQYIHLAPVSSVSLPTDIWIPSSSIVKPQLGTQYAVGYFLNFDKFSLETSVEAYYKNMKNVIEYKEGVLSLQRLNDNYDQNFFIGRGESFGTEFFIRKTAGKITGWLSYTLSKTTRSFDEIEGGRYFYAKHDRRHDISVSNNVKINEKWSASAIFVYATGNAITLPVSRYLIQGNIINQYSKRNAYRMPDYHRLDLSITYTYRKTERWESEWNFSVYNVYNRKNPQYIIFSTNGDLENYSLNVNIKQVSIFSILPSLSWRFKF